jgi:predicted nucleotidyltransferase
MELEEVKKKITPVLEEYGVEYAGVFGSVARGQATPESDVDILVKLGRPTGMFKYMRLISSLEQSLSKKVDLVTENSLNKFVKPYAMADLKTIYIADKSAI